MKSEDIHIPSSSVTTIAEQVPRDDRLPSIKSPLCQSPDLESLEFATADFYIDESMPSSIETPPKTSTEEKSIASDSIKIDTDKELKEKYEKELKECKVKLTEVENAAKSLQSLLLEKLPLLKTSTSDLKLQQLELSNLFNSDIVKLRETSAAVIKSFCSDVESSHQDVIDKLQTEKDEHEMMLKDEIEAEQAKCAELQNEIELAKKRNKEVEQDFNSRLDKAKQEQTELIEKHDLEIKEMIQKHELELEVEIDKLKAELIDRQTGLEKELETSVLVAQDKDSAIENLKKERIKLEETLSEKFQREKDEICDILAKEHDQKLNQAIQLEKEKMENEKSMLKETLNKVHESDTQKKLEELKQSLILEKQQELDLNQSTLILEHNKLTEEIKNRTREEKMSEMDKIKSDLEIKFQEDLARFSTEFNREKEVLVAELNKYKLKVFTESDVQTEFSEVTCDTQTGDSLLLDVLSNNSMQTDVIKLSDTSNQTEILDLSNLAVQTDEPDLVPTPVLSNISMQTESVDIDIFHLSIQTDKISLEQCCTQTDKIPENQSETQTETESVDHSSVQTDSISQSQSSSQTEELLCDQSQKGTEAADQEHDCVGGSKSSLTTSAIQTEDNENLKSMQDYEKVRNILQIFMNDINNSVC